MSSPKYSHSLPHKNIGALLGLIILASAALRLGYYSELRLSPIPSYTASNPNFDQHNFVRLADEIKSNRWIGSAVTDGSPMRHRMAQFYPYIIALASQLPGHDVYNVIALQLLIGVISVYLMFKTAALLFEDERVGLFAATLWAFYAPIIFFEGTLLRASLIAHLNLAAFYLTLKWVRAPLARRIICAGIIIGLSAAMRTNVLALFMLPYIFVMSKGPALEKYKPVLLFMLGFTLILVPFAVRNHLVGHKAIISSQGTDTFWNGNSFDSSGVGLTRTPIQKELAKEAGGKITKTLSILVREIKNHPREYFALYWRKIKMFLNGYEIPSNESFDLSRAESRTLKISFIDFRTIGSLALVGVFLMRRKVKNAGLLYGFLLTLSFSVIMFHVQSRYRIPAVPFFTLAAAWTLNHFYELSAARQFKRFVTLLTVLIAVGLFTLPDKVIIRTYFGDRVRFIDYSTASEAYKNAFLTSTVPDGGNEHYLHKALMFRERSLKNCPEGLRPAFLADRDKLRLLIKEQGEKI